MRRLPFWKGCGDGTENGVSKLRRTDRVNGLQTLHNSNSWGPEKMFELDDVLRMGKRRNSLYCTSHAIIRVMRIHGIFEFDVRLYGVPTSEPDETFITGDIGIRLLQRLTHIL